MTDQSSRRGRWLQRTADNGPDYPPPEYQYVTADELAPAAPGYGRMLQRTADNGPDCPPPEYQYIPPDNWPVRILLEIAEEGASELGSTEDDWIAASQPPELQLESIKSARFHTASVESSHPTARHRRNGVAGQPFPSATFSNWSASASSSYAI